MNEINLRELLKGNNLKFTKTRKEIYSYLKSTYSHPSAFDVYKEVKKKLPGISYATVYNVLNLFIEKGIIKEISTHEDKKRFDGDVSQHIHLICKECGKIEDLPLNDSSFIITVKEHGWEVEDSALNVYGICPECLKRKGHTRISHKN